jgi:hypothetical protein
MSTMMPPGSMAPLREIDENDVAFSLAGDEDDIELPASPSLRPASRGPQFSSLSSTTPMAPVPSHLERGARGRGSVSDHGFVVGGTLRRSRMPKFESSQPVSGLYKADEVSESAGSSRVHVSHQPLAAKRSFGFKPLNGHTIGPQPSSPEPNLPAVGSKSVGAKPSDMQSALPSQPAKFTPTRRSVRIQSPRTLSATPQTRPLGIPRSDQFRGRSGTSR